MASRFPRILFLLTAVPALLGAASPDQIEFFETKIRPVLVEKCYPCHSAKTMAMGELRLDSREAARKGGTRGAAVTPGAPEASVLLKAISYRDLDLKMPPTGKLSEREIADFAAWIEMGAPDPREERPPAKTTRKGRIDFDEGRKFWSFQPLAAAAPPSTSRPDWASSPVDAFILAKLEEQGLEPAPPADKRTLIRRVTFDLTGLPPTPREVEAFLADHSSDAFGSLVERLLASPHYGERWARHWLDLVRFAETNGHEYDNDKLDAWRYRDYVIRAFNDDLPYDRFVREQIAGDLLAEQRLSADGSRYESPVASGFYWLWEVLNSPTDSLKARADQVDNQIDVLGKAFFGLTVACARCHDHKFDPIPTADYYSLAGIFHSTQMSERVVDSPRRAARIAAAREDLSTIGEEIRRRLAEARRERAAELDRRLIEAAGALRDDPKGSRLGDALAEPDDPLYPFAKLALASERPFAERLGELQVEMRDWAAKADPAHPLWAERGDEIFDDFENGYGKWRIAGAAFGDAPARVAAPNQSLTRRRGGALADSFPGAEEFVGSLTSEKFRMPAPFVHVRLGGTKESAKRRGQAKLRFTVVADDHKSARAVPGGGERLGWRTLPMVKEKGRVCYLEIVDRSREGHIAVDRIVFSRSEQPPPIASAPDPRVLALLEGEEVDSLEDLARAYRGLALALLGETGLNARERALLAAIELSGAPLESVAGNLEGTPKREYEALAARRERIARSLPPSAFAMTSRDVNPRNVRIHLRGNHKNLGEEAPRRFLRIIAGENHEPFTSGSGRLELARWAASERNPLTARVMANRVWKHHFGRGIVSTPDNFGSSGERPTHPQLLDYLASRFIESGWSLKSLQRMILLTSAYRMRSRASERAREIDPENKLLSHMPVRRLEAEAIRDSVLAVAGTLDRRLYGPSVPPHISSYQDGRGKPASGPLDGRGRRSVYIEARRNFLTPLFLAFDYPLPASTIGRRGVSVVPSQALMMLNNEFINQQAEKWARMEVERRPDRRRRIEEMYLRAFARPPEPAEAAEIGEFLSRQGRRYGASSPDDPRPWTDLAHVLINTAEFIFVR